MRLLAAAALCLIAGPAIAQRVDTRIIDVRQHANGRESCRFNAVPDLHMTTAHLGGNGAFAEWAHKATDGNAWLHARFQPDLPLGTIQKLEVMLTPRIAAALSASLLLDGESSPVALSLTRVHPQSDRWTLVPADGTALARAMRHTKTLTLHLAGPQGKKLGSWQFRIGNLQDIAEYPGLVAWRCKLAPQQLPAARHLKRFGVDIAHRLAI
ncbi:hypothetical protein [Sphingomonas soli]|uniref:hypothetical protein n=1 Tax=Sphingomonas soli TaxID=266127 RepID=UPI000832C96B|nr:hypothetical protein [Sphingomonas soli]